MGLLPDFPHRTARRDCAIRRRERKVVSATSSQFPAKKQPRPIPSGPSWEVGRSSRPRPECRDGRGERPADGGDTSAGSLSVQRTMGLDDRGQDPQDPLNRPSLSVPRVGRVDTLAMRQSNRQRQNLPPVCVRGYAFRMRRSDYGSEDANAQRAPRADLLQPHVSRPPVEAPRARRAEVCPAPATRRAPGRESAEHPGFLRNRIPRWKGRPATPTRTSSGKTSVSPLLSRLAHENFQDRPAGREPAGLCHGSTRTQFEVIFGSLTKTWSRMPDAAKSAESVACTLTGRTDPSAKQN